MSLFWECRDCKRLFSIGLTTMRVRWVDGRAERLCADCDDKRDPNPTPSPRGEGQ